ncbi:DUF7539 family protein [Haloplanus salilacus]|uniref:DUF7539 family protein n=1 Tax=Haloplanus salilacus TaxID=2949994 RepID=UPI0030CD0694
MTDRSDERQLVLEVQSQLPSWTDDARTAAYADLFEGDDPLLTDEDLRLLDAVDSAMERNGGDGVWGTDRYGVHTGSPTDGSLDIVCVYHPRIASDSVLRDVDALDDETERRIDEALWRYSERVATLLGEKLDDYLGG